MDLSDWSEEELEARLAELQPIIDEFNALTWYRDLKYLIAEGFVTMENGRLYAEGEAVDLEM